MPSYIEVALPVPVRDTFSYRLPADIALPAPGIRVRVPFGRRGAMTGVVISSSNTTEVPPEKLRDVESVLDTEPVVPEELLHLCLWAARFYLHPLGEVVQAALPQALREGRTLPEVLAYYHTREGLGLSEDALKRAKGQQSIHQHLLRHQTLLEQDIDPLGFSPSALRALVKKGLIERRPYRQGPSSLSEQVLRSPPQLLNTEQKTAVEHIQWQRFGGYLLEGATGSGKTEVYLHLIARALQTGKQALVLIPEIGLSPQTLKRFTERFAVPIALLHSSVSEGERTRNWLAAARGEARIVIGTRLAALTPFAELGIIVVDEEHDRSYRQFDGFKYSARDIAVLRGHRLDIPVVLGSATPSFESLANVERGKYQRLTLHHRAQGKPPRMVIEDLRDKDTIAGLTAESLTALRDTVARGEQAIVFVNRRGYAPALVCHSCGWSAGCGHCDARLTLHSQPRHLRCHHCDRRQRVPTRCPECLSPELNATGLGTEQLEQSLIEHFPKIPVVRIDRDSTRRKDSLEQKLYQQEGPAIFVGTQMLAKGHHLPKLGLVVVVDADHGLLSSDFRSLEQLGQLITQIAGRAGRADIEGHVLIQSHRPDHPVLAQLADQGYGLFAESQLQERRKAGLPPYRPLVEIRAEHTSAQHTESFLQSVREHLTSHSSTPLDLVGPFPDMVERVNRRFRFCLHVMADQRPALLDTLRQARPALEKLPKANGLRWSLTLW